MAKKKAPAKKRTAAKSDPELAELREKVKALEAENKRLQQAAALTAASRGAADAEQVLRDQLDWHRRHLNKEA